MTDTPITTQDFRAEILLTEKQVAVFLHVSPSTLQQWRWKGIGPAFIKLCGAVRYTQADIDDYVNANRQTEDRGERS